MQEVHVPLLKFDHTRLKMNSLIFSLQCVILSMQRCIFSLQCLIFGTQSLVVGLIHNISHSPDHMNRRRIRHLAHLIILQTNFHPQCIPCNLINRSHRLGIGIDFTNQGLITRNVTMNHRSKFGSNGSSLFSRNNKNKGNSPFHCNELDLLGGMSCISNNK